MYYSKKPVLKGNPKNPEAVAAGCSPGVFEVRAGKLVANDLMLMKHDVAGAVEEFSNGEASIEYTDDFVFNLESFGQLTCQEIMEEAAGAIASQMLEFEKLVK